jgi:hypothetical protein
MPYAGNLLDLLIAVVLGAYVLSAVPYAVVLLVRRWLIGRRASRN